MTKQEIIDYMYENHVQGDFKIEEMAEDLAQAQWIPFPEPYKGDVTDSKDESTPVYLSELYLCDPDKNTECNKTSCYRNGGECSHTVHKEYRRVE